VSSGTCQSNNRYDVAQVDCETAATSLGLSDTSASLNSYSTRPPGCIYNVDIDSGHLRFNTLETSLTDCGSGDLSYDCICGRLATGTAFPQPTQHVRIPSLYFFYCAVFVVSHLRRLHASGKCRWCRRLHRGARARGVVHEHPKHGIRVHRFNLFRWCPDRGRL
jgi:hypothetical protein